jgi:hypothetical protein
MTYMLIFCDPVLMIGAQIFLICISSGEAFDLPLYSDNLIHC